MSVQNETARIQYTLTSTGQTLSVPFYFLNQEDIRVIRQVTGEPPQPLTLNTDYSVSGAGNEEGGEITMVTGNAGDKITIRRDISITQLLDYVYNDRFPAESHERGLDRLTMITQMLADDLDRTIRFPETDLFNTELSASRNGFVLSFGDDGDLSFNLRAADVSNLLLNGAATNFPSRLTYTVDTAEDPSEGGSLDNLRDLQKGDLNIVDRIPIQVATRGQVLTGDNPDGLGNLFSLFYGRKAGFLRVTAVQGPGLPPGTTGVLSIHNTPWFTNNPDFDYAVIRFNPENADPSDVAALGLLMETDYYLRKTPVIQGQIITGGKPYLTENIDDEFENRITFPNENIPLLSDPPIEFETSAKDFGDDGDLIIKAHGSWDTSPGSNDAFWVAPNRAGQLNNANVESIVAEADGGSAINAVELTPRDLGFGNATAITNYLNNIGPITVNAGSYYGDGKGGGGSFDLVNDGSLVANGGTIFAATGIGSGWCLVRNITNNYISVKDFGARGRGILAEDDRDAIQRTINYANSEHAEVRKVYVPKGQYYLNSTITVLGNKVALCLSWRNAWNGDPEAAADSGARDGTQGFEMFGDYSTGSNVEGRPEEWGTLIIYNGSEVVEAVLYVADGGARGYTGINSLSAHSSIRGTLGISRLNALANTFLSEFSDGLALITKANRIYWMDSRGSFVFNRKYKNLDFRCSRKLTADFGDGFYLEIEGVKCSRNWGDGIRVAGVTSTRLRNCSVSFYTGRAYILEGLWYYSACYDCIFEQWLHPDNPLFNPLKPVPVANSEEYRPYYHKPGYLYEDWAADYAENLIGVGFWTDTSNAPSLYTCGTEGCIIPIVTKGRSGVTIIDGFFTTHCGARSYYETLGNVSSDVAAPSVGGEVTIPVGTDMTASLSFGDIIFVGKRTGVAWSGWPSKYEASDNFTNWADPGNVYGYFLRVTEVTDSTVKAKRFDGSGTSAGSSVLVVNPPANIQNGDHVAKVWREDLEDPSLGLIVLHGNASVIDDGTSGWRSESVRLVGGGFGISGLGQGQVNPRINNRKLFGRVTEGSIVECVSVRQYSKTFREDFSSGDITPPYQKAPQILWDKDVFNGARSFAAPAFGFQKEVEEELVEINKFPGLLLTSLRKADEKVADFTDLMTAESGVVGDADLIREIYRICFVYGIYDNLSLGFGRHFGYRVRSDSGTDYADRGYDISQYLRHFLTAGATPNDNEPIITANDFDFTGQRYLQGNAASSSVVKNAIGYTMLSVFAPIYTSGNKYLFGNPLSTRTLRGLELRITGTSNTHLLYPNTAGNVSVVGIPAASAPDEAVFALRNVVGGPGFAFLDKEQIDDGPISESDDIDAFSNRTRIGASGISSSPSDYLNTTMKALLIFNKDIGKAPHESFVDLFKDYYNL